MLHSGPRPASALEADAPAALVTCRARVWRVLDMRRDDEVTTWRLACRAETPRLIASPPDEVLAVRGRVARVSRRAWVHAVYRHAVSGSPSWWPQGATHLPITLLPWQCVPAMMILSGHHRRVLVADAVGMGKTVQAGVLLHEIHAREPDAATLVVTPPGLIEQWANELRTRARLDASVLDAPALRREAAYAPAFVDGSRAGSCWLVSMDLLRQPDVVLLLARTRWTLLVVDEAHLVSPGSARLAAVAAVARASVRVLLLTATPAAGGPASADDLRRVGGHAGEPPMPVLRRDPAVLARPPRRSCVLRLRLDRSHAEICDRLDDFAARARRERGAEGLLPALVLRRRAASCPWALRRSLERRLLVLGQDTPPGDLLQPGLFDADRPSDQDAADEALMRVPAWADAPAERHEIERLLALAVCLPPAGRKLCGVQRLVRRCRQPVVIFTAFLDTLRALRPLLPGRGVVVVHGQQPDALRAQAIDAFVTGEAAVLLATDAAAEGLNLHARCRLVIHAEVPSSSRVLEQRSGRLDRYGQAHRVHSVVMASHAQDDVEALARLRRRTGEDDEWMASVSPVRCRRSRVAATTRQRHAGTPAATLPSVHGGRQDRVGLQDWAVRQDGAVPHCVLPPGRWRRLACMLGVPSSARSLRAVTLRVAGGPELSSTRVPVVLSADGPLDSASMSAAIAHHPALRQHIARAHRLAHRLASWERQVTSALSEARDSSPPALFDDAAVRSPSGSVTHGEANVWIAVDTVAVVSASEQAP